MSKLLLPYVCFPEKDLITGKIKNEIYRPLIPIRISYNHTISFYSFDCLVDSGSDKNLFPAQIGELIGIKIRKGPKRIICGIGNSNLEAFTHIVKIFINATGKINFETTIDFSYEQQLPLLGRNGFFNHFISVNFKDAEKTLELETK
jgi:hypothetical protein